MSAVGIATLGGIGIWPQTPEPLPSPFSSAWRRRPCPLVLGGDFDIGRTDELLVRRGTRRNRLSSWLARHRARHVPFRRRWQVRRW